MTFLKTHPFAVQAFFESSLVLTFSVPKEELSDMIPECLELDTFDDKWAFIAVAVVQTKALRPKGFPRFMGNDFVLVGYRIFVRYTTNAGKRLRGLYILRSETDKKKMQYLGNIFTKYKYEATDIHISSTTSGKSIKSAKSSLFIDVDTEEQAYGLPSHSPFKDWKEARRFAGPLPFTFSYEPETMNVLIVEGVRQNWEPKPVKVNEHRIGFIDSLGLNQAKLANAFMISDIPYHWKKGRIEKWKG